VASVPESASSTLKALLALGDTFDGASSPRKVALLERMERASLASAKQVARLHELLCWWRAYPEGPEVLVAVERLLAGFSARPDLLRFRGALADSGIAGTDLRFRFYWLMALRMADRWPDALSIDWDDFEHAEDLVGILDLLLPYAETPALDAFDRTAREWIGTLKAEGETDATFLIRRFEAMQAERAVKEHLYERLDVPVRVAPGPGVPCRTGERWPASEVHFQRGPLRRGRPALKRAVRTLRPTVRELAPADGRRMIDLANDVMVPRHRDLLVFLHGDENDVRVLDFGEGLEFAAIGARPERRLVLEAVYGFLTLKNGVPIGYVLNSALFGSCELAYNVFPTFRGAEAAHVYARFLAAVHHLFGADSFTIDPYQLGRDNREGLLSGAWWFYYKLGFRPRDPAIRALVRTEVAALGKDPSHRTSLARLNELAADNVYLSLGRPRADVLGRVSLGDIGLAASRVLSERFGADREGGIEACADEAARRLGFRGLSGLSAAERIAWERWAPLLLALDGVESWSAAEKRGAVEVVCAKGGRRESDFVRLFDAHARLRRAVFLLSRPPRARPAGRARP
jgi:hypothetical protein